MKTYKEWQQQKALAEFVGTPVTPAGEEVHAEPNENDWEFYHTKIAGRAKTYLNWFIEEIENNKLSLVRKGFIVQEVMAALGMNVSQFVRVMSNIKRAIQKKQMMDKQAANPQQPAAPQSPAAAPATPAAAPYQPPTNQQAQPSQPQYPWSKPQATPEDKKAYPWSKPMSV